MQGLASLHYLVDMNRAWEEFVKFKKIAPQVVRPVIASSWGRCSFYGIDPHAQSGKEVLKDSEFQTRRERCRNLIRVAVPFMQMLIDTCGEDFVAVLGDEEGYVVEDFGKPEVLDWAKQYKIGKGANLGEMVVGTNTVGTVPVERVPMQKALYSGGFSDQEIVLENNRGRFHFTMTAQPIHNDQGEIIGAVSTLREIKAVHRLVTNMVGAKARFTFDDLIGDSEVFHQVLFLARRAAASSSTILLQGESGTGKELFAQAIHNASKRAGGPFIAVNCAAIPRDLIGSELFGYEEGAFTGARRGGGAGQI